MRQLYDWFEYIYDMDLNWIDNTFPLLARGSSRDIYALNDNLVMKLATNDDGTHQCRVEQRVFRKSGSYFKRYLCPVLWHKHGMLVMVKAEPFMPLEEIKGDQRVDLSLIGQPHIVHDDLVRLSRKFGLLYDDLISLTSWGYINKWPVLIDYGCTK